MPETALLLKLKLETALLLTTQAGNRMHYPDSAVLCFCCAHKAHLSIALFGQTSTFLLGRPGLLVLSAPAVLAIAWWGTLKLDAKMK
jgi:hypothetical protein